MLYAKPLNELSWMQGPAAREKDVEKDEAVAIAADGLKDERNITNPNMGGIKHGTSTMYG